MNDTTRLILFIISYMFGVIFCGTKTSLYNEFNYEGVMVVPITFMNKYNPEQFEILGATESEGKGFSNGLWDKKSNVAQPLVNGIRKYKRLFIQKNKTKELK